MRISLSITDFSAGGAASLGADLVAVARAADNGGLHTLWVSDHLLQADPNAELDEPMLEAYSTLGFLAAHTSRIRLGTMVTAATFRPPALLIKSATTLDVLSGGRAWLGLGAGYRQDEATAMGLDLPPVQARFERLEETLQLARQMSSGDQSAFAGRHYRLERPVNSPRALSQPHLPVLVGGMGERQTLRLVARYADACNLFDIPDGGETIRRKLDVLARHCEEAQRPYDAIDKTLSTRLAPGETADELIERCGRLSELGITHLVFITTGPWDQRSIETLATAAQALTV